LPSDRRTPQTHLVAGPLQSHDDENIESRAFSGLCLRGAGHLYQNDVDCNAKFDEAIATLNRFTQTQDLVILGNDLADEGQADEYQTVRRAVSTLWQSVFFILSIMVSVSSSGRFSEMTQVVERLVVRP